MLGDTVIVFPYAGHPTKYGRRWDHAPLAHNLACGRSRLRERERRRRRDEGPEERSVAALESEQQELPRPELRRGRGVSAESVLDRSRAAAALQPGARARKRRSSRRRARRVSRLSREGSKGEGSPGDREAARDA